MDWGSQKKLSKEEYIASIDGEEKVAVRDKLTGKENT